MQKSLLVNVLGTPSFSWQDQILNIPTRKATALLCYLALHNSTSREELSELLWGDPKSQALRTELHRLRQLPGASIWLETEDKITLHATSDLTKLEEALAKQNFKEALEIYSGEPEKTFIRDLKPKDALGFMEWLEEKRITLEGLLKDALQRRIKELEEAGEFTEALELAHHLLKRDLLDESIHRTIMRIELGQGHSQTAQAQFEACCRVLAEELDVKPMPETLELAQEIKDAIQKLPSHSSFKVKNLIPPKLSRPPVLVGREKEWARMEAAWEKKQTIMISGLPGVGKTRLMLDFAHSKGASQFSGGRPGDTTLPFSTLTRYYRLFFQKHPEAISKIEPWAQHELARLLPEYFNEQPKPITSDAEHSRFESALLQLGEIFTITVKTMCSDDLQFYDPVSFGTMARVNERVMQNLSPSQFNSAILCFRLNEMPPEFTAVIAQYVEAGIVIHIELEPLDELGVAELLKGLELPHLNSLAPRLKELTGGNPQFIVEVLKSLYEQGWSGSDLPEQISLPKKVGAAIEKRLNKLSKKALTLAQTIAVFKQIKSIRAKELAKVLDMRLMEISEGLAELEQAQIIKDGTFFHDLLYEAVINAMPKSTYRILNEQVAEWLEAQAAEPARIAHHWTEAGMLDNALPWHIKAAEVVLAQGSAEQANVWLEGVLEVVEPKSEFHEQAQSLLKTIN